MLRDDVLLLSSAAGVRLPENSLILYRYSSARQTHETFAAPPSCDIAGMRIRGAIGIVCYIGVCACFVPLAERKPLNTSFSVTSSAVIGICNCFIVVGEGKHGKSGHSHHEAKEEGNESTDVVLFLHKKAPFK